ncbi:MAG: sigma-54-dependent Fis family transcriptional regulator [Desulfobacteraceae bacterium]|nr:sigma-54-dependent Fis family transcriptional regulator [Desulfobacteraceae bacterium]
MAKILVIDDDQGICRFFKNILENMDHAVTLSHSLDQGLAISKSKGFDLVILDLDLPDGNGLTILPALLKSPTNPEVIIITGTGDARGAELAFKYGAWDYVQKPCRFSEVSLPIMRALQYRGEKRAGVLPVALVRSNIIGESDAIQRCLVNIAKASSTDANVLVTGETGTGKELFAKAIHENSKRSQKNFIAVDCGALPDTLVESILFGHEKGAFSGALKKRVGLIQQAQGGTLMLDEIGDLSLDVQKAFLRTLQERTIRPIGSNEEIPVDFRLVAATNRNLHKMVEEYSFRQDLLYRICAIEIKLPLLKDREHDIEEITIKKIHQLCRRYEMETKGISQEFFNILKVQNWPGNVRELINVLEYALAAAGLDPTLFPKHLPPEYRLVDLDFSPAKTEPLKNNQARNLPFLNVYRDTAEKKYLTLLLKQTENDRKKACKVSGISQSRLYQLLKKHDLPGFSH